MWNGTEMHAGFGWRNLKVGEYLQVTGMDVKEIGSEGMDRILLAEVRVTWQAPVYL
jgi:hypothetical protein